MSCKILQNLYCSHFRFTTKAGEHPYLASDDCIGVCNVTLTANIPYVAFRVPFTNLQDFKNWLDEEAAKGTPVTIWYQLVTPEVEQLN